jgi:hypothetical protein
MNDETGSSRHTALDKFGLEQRDADCIVHEFDCGGAGKDDKYQGAGKGDLKFGRNHVVMYVLPREKKTHDYVMDDDICSALKKSGVPCTYRAKYDDGGEDGRRVCGVHRLSPPVDLGICSICLTRIDSKRSCKTLKKCGHVFHASCITSWLRRDVLTCPVCRAPCIEEIAARPHTLSRKMRALLRTVPAPDNGFFPAHVIALLESPDIGDAIAISDGDRQLLVEMAYQTFTENNFFSMMRHLRL